MATDSVVRVGLLLPDVLGTYGDNGNAEVLCRRLHWRGIAAEVVPVPVGSAVPAGLDAYVIGGGEDTAQSLATEWLGRTAGLRHAVERGTPVLAVCAGLQVLGREFAVRGGPAPAGLGLLDAVTVPAARRAVGEILARPATDLLAEPLTGFENHQGRTRLGPAAEPLGTVVRGVGNGDGIEGLVQGHVVGTYLHGPALARNPELADLLLRWVIGDPLPPLDLPSVRRLRRARLRAARGLFGRR